MKFKFKPVYFFVALTIGLIACYVMAPTPTVVVKFPSPFNSGKIVYRDTSENCFEFKAQKVKCTPGAIKQPVTEEMSLKKKVRFRDDYDHTL
jgi:hypothetical protein